MMFPPDHFMSSTDQPILEESPYQTYHYRQDIPPKEPPKKARKTKDKKLNRSKKPVPDPNSGNEYSKIMLLGFTLIKFFFFFIAGLVIAYVFTWFFNQDLAVSLLGFGSDLIGSLVVCVSCIVAIVIILESCR